jgi:hypothetical protein
VARARRDAAVARHPDLRPPRRAHAQPRALGRRRARSARRRPRRGLRHLVARPHVRATGPDARPARRRPRRDRRAPPPARLALRAHGRARHALGAGGRVEKARARRRGRVARDVRSHRRAARARGVGNATRSRTSRSPVTARATTRPSGAAGATLGSDPARTASCPTASAR